MLRFLPEYASLILLYPVVLDLFTSRSGFVLFRSTCFVPFVLFITAGSVKYSLFPWIVLMDCSFPLLVLPFLLSYWEWSMMYHKYITTVAWFCSRSVILIDWLCANSHRDQNKNSSLQNEKKNTRIKQGYKNRRLHKLNLMIFMPRATFTLHKRIACSFRWFIMVESTIRWFVVREKYCWIVADSAE
jgi:hypothetical protein